MNLNIPVLEDLPSLKGKSVLLRADFNEPIVEDADGTRRVADDFRIRATLPTINWLIEHGARVTACSHLGRPKGKPDPRYDMAPVRDRLNELVPGVELLENLRFDPGEEANTPEFVDRLISGHDVYVNDAFGSSHRAHASIVGPPARLPSAAGRLLAREAEVLTELLEEPNRPFVAIIGGAKVADKLGVLHALAQKVDTLIVGGGMSYTFLVAQGRKVADSLIDADHVKDCAELLEKHGTKIVLPTDLVALSPGGQICVYGDSQHQPTGTLEVFAGDIPDGWEGLDMGPNTRAADAAVIASAGTVLWNGPFGVFEDPRFSLGTRAIAEAVAACGGFTVVGGGDTVSAIDAYGVEESIDHVSSGGGASLEFIEFGDLPGLAALRNASNNPHSKQSPSTRP
jgi:phosphoglycerate kinase